MLLWSQSGYEWIYEEIYGVDFFTSTQALEEQGLGDTRCPVKKWDQDLVPPSLGIHCCYGWQFVCSFNTLINSSTYLDFSS